jgi:HAD superfamily hydrolase (TIGR01484 family)
MRYAVLASDYDGTLASDGAVDAPTIAALEKARGSGRRLLLLTGRQLKDLRSVFPPLEYFDRAIAEDGALLYRPQEKTIKTLGEPPPAAFVDALRRKAIAPLSVGQVIVATRQPNEAVVLDIIRDMGLELHITLNKGAVMVLPSGVNKASGLTAALAEIGVSQRNTVGIGDGENDHAFLALCGYRVAVANALPKIKEAADLVTSGARGEGVIELIDRLVANDLPRVEH